MTAFDSVETRSLTIVAADGEPVVTLQCAPNTQHKAHRLSLDFLGDNPAEIQVVPGPNFKGPGIWFQIMGLGPVIAGKGRPRLAMSLNMDNDGGLQSTVDSTTTDASGAVGQRDAPALVLNAGEGQGVYVVIHPSDNSIEVQDRVAGTSTGHISAATLIKHLRRIPK